MGRDLGVKKKGVWYTKSSLNGGASEKNGVRSSAVRSMC